MSIAKTYEEVVDFIANETDPGKLIAFCPSDESRERVARLLEREKSDEVSSEQRSELDHYLQLEHLMRLIKSRAHDQLANA